MLAFKIEVQSSFLTLVAAQNLKVHLVAVLEISIVYLIAI